MSLLRVVAYFISVFEHICCWSVARAMLVKYFYWPLNLSSFVSTAQHHIRRGGEGEGGAIGEQPYSNVTGPGCRRCIQRWLAPRYYREVKNAHGLRRWYHVKSRLTTLLLCYSQTPMQIWVGSHMSRTSSPRYSTGCWIFFNDCTST